MIGRGILSERLGRITNSGFVRAVAVLSTGQMVAAALPILAAPILGRLYLPADYGVLATYMAIANVLSATSTFALEQGVIAERSEWRAVALVQVCMWTASLVASVAAGLAFALVIWMGGQPAFAEGRWWILLLPVTTLAAGGTIAVSALANRRQRYGIMARVQVYSVAATVATSISLGMLHWGVHGLFTSYFLGQFIAVLVNVGIYRSLVGQQTLLKLATVVALVRRHRKFAVYSLPSALLGTVTQQLPVFALSALGAAPIVGAFTRARQLISMPLTLLGASIGQVFRQRAAEQYRTTGSCRQLYQRTLMVLLLVGLPPITVLVWTGPELFRLVLGPKWGQAGELARILAPALILQLVCNPLSTIFYFQNRQQEDFYLSILSVCLTAALVAFGMKLSSGGYGAVAGFVLAMSITYCVYIVRGWQLAKIGRGGA